MQKIKTRTEALKAIGTINILTNIPIDTPTSLLVSLGRRVIRKDEKRFQSAIDAILRWKGGKVKPSAPIIEKLVTDFSVKWNVEIAKEAFVQLESSGQSKTAFAKAHGFSPSRFRTWASKV